MVGISGNITWVSTGCHIGIALWLVYLLAYLAVSTGVYASITLWLVYLLAYPRSVYRLPYRHITVVGMSVGIPGSVYRLLHILSTVVGIAGNISWVSTGCHIFIALWLVYLLAYPGSVYRLPHRHITVVDVSGGIPGECLQTST